MSLILKKHIDSLWNIPPARRISFIKSGDSGVTPVIHSEYDLLTDIKAAATTIRDIVESDDQIFNIRHVRSRRVAIIDLSNQKAKNLLDAMQLDAKNLKHVLPGHFFNPYVNILLKKQEQFCYPTPFHLHLKNMVDDDAIGAVKQLNNFAEEIRREGKSEKTVSMIDDWNRRVRKRFSGARRYVNALFERHARVLAVRVDLGYCMEQDNSPEGLTTLVSLEAAKTHMAKFDRFVRLKYPVLGHMHCREYGLLSGHHFHVLYFLNRDLVQSDVHIAREMGEHWTKEITRRQGRYYNCNAMPYKNNGIGTIHHTDYEKRDILLNKVVAYITKKDFWLFHQAGGKTFAKGIMPGPPSALGRPRKASKGQRVGGASVSPSISAQSSSAVAQIDALGHTSTGRTAVIA